MLPQKSQSTEIQNSLELVRNRVVFGVVCFTLRQGRTGNLVCIDLSRQLMILKLYIALQILVNDVKYFERQ